MLVNTSDEELEDTMQVSLTGYSRMGGLSLLGRHPAMPMARYYKILLDVYHRILFAAPRAFSAGHTGPESKGGSSVASLADTSC
eukprot:9062396-Pyramimonas_sp.AAC.1